MRRFIPFLLLMAACSSDGNTSKNTLASCPEPGDPIVAMAGKQGRVYYTVPGFNPKSKECWQVIRAAAKKEGGAAVIAFIDAADFAPGKDGMYDNDEAKQRQVIAQVLVNEPLGVFEFMPDPFGFGKYTEPK